MNFLKSAYSHFIILLMFLLIGCQENPSEIKNADTFEKTFGGGNDDYGRKVIETSDGGFAIIGSTIVGGKKSEIYFIKTDKLGNVQLEKHFGDGNDDVGISLAETTDGGFIITGNTESKGKHPWDLFLLKIDSEGNQEFEKTFGGGSFQIGNDVIQTGDGGFVVTGYSWEGDAHLHDLMLIRTDENGFPQFEKTLGGKGIDGGEAVIEMPDGSFVVVGVTSEDKGEDSDIYLLKTDNQGNTIFEHTIGSGGDDFGFDVHSTLDGGLAIVGQSTVQDSIFSDMLFLKTNGNGIVEFDKKFGGVHFDVGNGIIQTQDGGFMIVGSSRNSENQDNDLYLLKTNSVGEIQFEHKFGGAFDDVGYAVRELKEGGFIIVGESEVFGDGEEDIYLIKTDPQGNVQ